jgi:hypothetical protein
MKTIKILIVITFLVTGKASPQGINNTIKSEVQGKESVYNTFVHKEDYSRPRIGYMNVRYNFEEYRKQYPVVSPIREAMYILIKDHDKMLQAISNAFGAHRITELAENDASLLLIMDVNNNNELIGLYISVDTKANATVFEIEALENNIVKAVSFENFTYNVKANSFSGGMDLEISFKDVLAGDLKMMKRQRDTYYEMLEQHK